VVFLAFWFCFNVFQSRGDDGFVFIFQISDEGGGICRSEMDKLFNYMYSTAPRPPPPDVAQTTPLVCSMLQSLQAVNTFDLQCSAKLAVVRNHVVSIYFAVANQMKHTQH
jgi:hypothetical protein